MTLPGEIPSFYNTAGVVQVARLFLQGISRASWRSVLHHRDSCKVHIIAHMFLYVC